MIEVIIINSELAAKASVFAYRAHENQVKKYTKLPYFTHLYDVAKMVQAFGIEEIGVAAAFLHDTLEDTDTDYANLVLNFGEEVSNLVLELTDEYTSEAYPFYNRRQRKELEAERLKKISPLAQSIKLADLIDNSSTIVKYDAKFARIYLQEKKLYLGSLTEGHPHLKNLAENVLLSNMSRLGMV